MGGRVSGWIERKISGGEVDGGREKGREEERGEAGRDDTISAMTTLAQESSISPRCWLSHRPSS